MIRRSLLCAALAVSGCQGGPTAEAPARADLAAELVRRPPGDGPPKGPDGACWANDTSPAVIETVTEQVVVTPAVLGPDGVVLTPATYRSSAHQKIVQDRQSVWFRTPCPEALSVDFVATVQRALKARGLYLLPLTGQMDAATGRAIRQFQQPLGLDSAVLSLAAARDLGVVAKDLGQFGG